MSPHWPWHHRLPITTTTSVVSRLWWQLGVCGVSAMTSISSTRHPVPVIPMTENISHQITTRLCCAVFYFDYTINFSASCDECIHICWIWSHLSVACRVRVIKLASNWNITQTTSTIYTTRVVVGVYWCGWVDVLYYLVLCMNRCKLSHK